jgi:hypothetical protein
MQTDREEIIRIFMDEGYSLEDAQIAIEDMRHRILVESEDATEVLEDYGFEPDYLLAII